MQAYSLPKVFCQFGYALVVVQFLFHAILWVFTNDIILFSTRNASIAHGGMVP